MAIGSGLGGQIMTAEETTYGTGVTPDRAYEFLSESLERNNRTLVSNGIRSGTRNLRRGSKRVLVGHDGSGDINLEVTRTGFGRWFKHGMGGASTITQQAATAAYLQVHPLGDLTGRYQTVQKGVPQTDGTVKPFTFLGGKITSFELSGSVDEILQFTASMDFRSVTTATALASPTFSNAKVFHWGQAAITLNGVDVAAVTGHSISVNNNVNTERYYMGQAGLKSEPLPNDFPEVTGTLDAEFVSQATMYDAYAADTSLALVITYTGDNIASTYDEKLTITVPLIKLGGDTPKLSGPEVVTQSVPFEGLYDGTNAGMTISYMSTDTLI